jgi:phenylalanyl-tRNA synthetase beta chain
MHMVAPSWHSTGDISMPPSPNEHYIRSSLLPNLCKAAADNLRFFADFAIFESAQVFSSKDFQSPYDPRESLPLQRRSVTGAFVSDPENVNSLFRRAKGTIEALRG